MPPLQLQPNEYSRLTIVLTNTHRELLEKLFEKTFDKKEYIFFDMPDVTDPPDRQAQLLRVRINTCTGNGTISLPPEESFNLACYFDLDDDAPARLRWLSELQKYCRPLLGVRNDVEALAFILKASHDTEGDMLRFDQCLTASMDAEIPLCAIDHGLGVQLDSPLKASTRYLHILSRNSELRQSILQDRQHLCFLGMMEHDIEGANNIQQAIDGLTKQLDGMATAAELETFLQEQLELVKKRLEARLNTFDVKAFPIRTDSIGKPLQRLFCREKTRDTLADLTKTLQQTFDSLTQEACAERVLLPDDEQRIRHALLDKFPIRFIRTELYDSLKKISEAKSRAETPYTPELSATGDMDSMREQIAAQHKKHIRHELARAESLVLHEIMCISAGLCAGDEELARHEKRLLDEIRELNRQKVNLGGAKDADDFLRNRLEQLPSVLGLVCIQMYSNRTILLVSRRIREDWAQYRGMIGDELAKNAYDYGMLEEQEFQVLQICEFRYDEYVKSRRSIFRLPEEDANGID